MHGQVVLDHRLLGQLDLTTGALICKHPASRCRSSEPRLSNTTPLAQNLRDATSVASASLRQKLASRGAYGRFAAGALVASRVLHSYTLATCTSLRLHDSAKTSMRRSNTVHPMRQWFHNQSWRMPWDPNHRWMDSRDQGQPRSPGSRRHASRPCWAFPQNRHRTCRATVHTLLILPIYLSSSLSLEGRSTRPVEMVASWLGGIRQFKTIQEGFVGPSIIGSAPKPPDDRVVRWVPRVWGEGASAKRRCQVVTVL